MDTTLTRSASAGRRRPHTQPCRPSTALDYTGRRGENIAYGRHAMPSPASVVLNEYLMMTESDASSAALARSYSHSNSHTHARIQTATQTPRHIAEQANNGWDAWWDPATADTSAPRRPGAALGRPAQIHKAMASAARRGSESSVSSFASTTTSTPHGDRGFNWSNSSTPESVSPMSPYDSDSLNGQEVPERPSPKTAFASGTMASPKASQIQMSGRLARTGHVLSRSVSVRYRTTPIESSVPEEEEGSHTEQGSTYEAPEPHCSDNTLLLPVPDKPSQSQGDAPVSNLHQRRQQRQQKMATYSPFPQPPKAKLSPLPPLPLQPRQEREPTRMPTAQPRRTLNREATRSLPQLRNYHVSPPPTESLPPLPPVPHMSPMFAASPRIVAVPRSPATLMRPSTPSYVPPRPTACPPPPPVHIPETVTPVLCAGKENMPPASSFASREAARDRMPEANRWEAEFERHKILLSQFPKEAPQPGERLKMLRTHKSLGNLRMRSRAHSTPIASDDTVANSPGLVSSSKADRNRSHMAKHTKSKSLWEIRPADGSLPEVPQSNANHISVFEDDSDDEGETDTVRRFVRNLFSRRTRNEMAIGSVPHGHDTRSASAPVPKEHVAPVATDIKTHNSRRKNHSGSSSLSIATTVGGSTTSSSATTAASITGDVSSPVESDCQNDSPRTSNDQFKQLGPLFTRMFVRRSH